MHPPFTWWHPGGVLWSLQDLWMVQGSSLPPSDNVKSYFIVCSCSSSPKTCFTPLSSASVIAPTFQVTPFPVKTQQALTAFPEGAHFGFPSQDGHPLPPESSSGGGDGKNPSSCAFLSFFLPNCTLSSWRSELGDAAPTEQWRFGGMLGSSW